jgi:hypothetical protein
LADAATANASPTRNATLKVGPSTIATRIDTAPTTQAAIRATRTVVSGPCGLPEWITFS